MQMYVSDNEIIYFDSFGVEHVSQEIENLLDIKT